MAYDSIPAAFGLNKYLWAKIVEAGILDTANYGGLIPIIPIQESALLQQAMDATTGIKSHPYIVYSWYQNGQYQDWFLNCDNVVYRIYATDGGKQRELSLLIGDHLKRWDESAQAINRWIGESELGPEYKAYDYKYINIQSSTGGTPTAAESEPVMAMITVKVEYTTDRDTNPL